MTDAAALDAWVATLGHRFARPALLWCALTHPTWVNEHRGEGLERQAAPALGPDYERLEFLGDAVLGLLVSRALLAAFPNEQEGALSRRRARAVRKEALAAWGRELGVTPFVRVGRGLSGAPLGDSIVADVLEALVGAAFCDGGLAAVEALLAGTLGRRLEAARGEGARRDAKTELQELCHRLGLAAPRYQVVEQAGPAHARHFSVALTLDPAAGLAPLVAAASSKKAAEQASAKRGLERLAARPPAP